MNQLSLHIELPYEVYFEYQPFEPKTQTYPGCDASITITAIERDNLDIFDTLSDEDIARVGDMVWDALEDRCA